MRKSRETGTSNNTTLRNFVDSKNLFTELKFHTFDQHPIENHISLLIKTIIEKYFDIRLSYIARCTIDHQANRQYFSKKLNKEI